MPTRRTRYGAGSLRWDGCAPKNGTGRQQRLGQRWRNLHMTMQTGGSSAAKYWTYSCRRSGDPAIRRSGDPAIRRSGDPAIRRSGDPAIRRSGDPAIRRSGDPAIRRSGDPAIRRSGDPAIILRGVSSALVKPRAKQFSVRPLRGSKIAARAAPIARIDVRPSLTKVIASSPNLLSGRNGQDAAASEASYVVPKIGRQPRAACAG